MKKLILLTTLLAIGLSSCLKDTRYLNFAGAGNIVNFPLSGLPNFGGDAVTSDTAVIKFGVDYATANPNPALTVTLGVDTTLVAKFNAANPGIVYNVLPASAYVFTATTVNIPAGAQFAYSTITINKYLLDPAKSYMLPVVIKSAAGVPISANFSTHYYHVIGNDFAGAYRYNFERFNGTDSTASLNGLSFNGGSAIFVPVSPTEVQVYTAYASPPPLLRYDLTFVKNSDGTYSNFQLSFVPGDVAAALAGGITITQGPVFLTVTPNSNTLAGPYTYAQALKLFRFQFTKHTGSYGYIVDTYIK
jgi:hypothetical protein